MGSAGADGGSVDLVDLAVGDAVSLAVGDAEDLAVAMQSDHAQASYRRRSEKKEPA